MGPRIAGAGEEAAEWGCDEEWEVEEEWESE
jgi:hypothetical protein